MVNCHNCGYRYSDDFLNQHEIRACIICPKCGLEFKISDNKIFFSFTSELIDLMDNVRLKILGLNYDPILYKGKFDIKEIRNDAIKSCFSNIRNSDFFVLLVDKQYGTIVDEENRISILEKEFTCALEESLPILVFIREEVYNQVKPYKEQKLYEISEEEFRGKGFAGEKSIYDFILRMKGIEPKIWTKEFKNAEDIIKEIENKWGKYQIKNRLVLETEISNLIEKSILKDYFIKIEWEDPFISWQGEGFKVPDTLTLENLNIPIDLNQEPSDWVKKWENNWCQLLEKEEVRSWFRIKLKLLMNGIRGLMYNSLSDSLIIVPPPNSYFQLIWNRLENLKKAAVFGGSGKGKSKFILYLAAFWKEKYKGLVFLVNDPNILEERHWNMIDKILNKIDRNILFIIDDFQNISEYSQSQIKKIVELREKNERGKDWWLVGFTIPSMYSKPKSMVTTENQLLMYKYWGFNSQEVTLDKEWDRWKQFFKVWWMWLSHNFDMINNKKIESIHWGKINAPWEITAILGGLNEKINSYFNTHIVEKTLYLLCASLFLLNNEKIFGKDDLELLLTAGPQRTRDQLKEISNQANIKFALDSILNKWQQQKGENPWLLPPCIPTISHPKPINFPHKLLAIDLLANLERNELYYLIENYLGRVYKGLLPACELFEKNEEGGIISALSRLNISQGKLNFDELIGILIVGKWNNYSIINSIEFIECIQEYCLDFGYEFKRQVSEILPFLFDLNLNGAKSIVGILRKDWDDKWKSDIRRRVIEALELIMVKEHSFIKKQIQIIEGDEIFTLIAIVELLNSWRKRIGKLEAEKIFKDFIKEMKKFNYYNEDISILNKFWKLLSVINSNIEKGLKKVEILCYHENINLKICLSRNLHLFYDKFPQKTIGLMKYFLEEDKDKNVRRPIAKEKSIKFLLSILQIEEFEENVIELIWQLIKDKDTIIRITCFDYIERILQINQKLGIQIINYIISNEKNSILLERAKLWKHTIDFKNL